MGGRKRGTVGSSMWALRALQLLKAIVYTNFRICLACLLTAHTSDYGRGITNYTTNTNAFPARCFPQGVFTTWLSAHSAQGRQGTPLSAIGRHAAQPGAAEQVPLPSQPKGSCLQTGRNTSSTAKWHLAQLKARPALQAFWCRRVTAIHGTS